MKSASSGTVNRRQLLAGFSAIELMVVIAIMGILAAMAAPSFVASIERYKVNGLRDELIANIQLARMEAIRRGMQVVLIRKTNCLANLSSINDWSCGYDLFVDTNANGALDNGDTPLKSVVLPVGYALKQSNKVATLRANSWGQIQNTGNGFSITALSSNSNLASTAICITIGGRIRTIAGATQCS